MTTSCSACQRSIIWTTTTNGRRMPVDAEPTPDGNVVLESLGQGIAPIAHVNSDRFGPRYTSHFATCPNADEFRRKR